MPPWGHRVAASLSLLAAGCSPSIEMAPPVPRPVATVAADPPDAGPGLTPLRPLMDAVATEAVKPESSRRVAFGKGVLWYGDLRQGGECPVAGFSWSTCHFMQMAPWASAPPVASPGAVGAAGAWSPLRAAPPGWRALSPGREVVYAVNDERWLPGEDRTSKAFELIAIDERGEAKTLLTLPTGPERLTISGVIELPGGLMLVTEGERWSEIGMAPVARQGEALTLRRAVRTGIAALGVRASASDARAVRQGGLRAAFGSYSLAPALDARGEPDGGFFLAWTEAIPPPKRSPAGVLPPWRRGRHECGRGSRWLGDLSVDKRVHVTRFDARGQSVSDRTVDEASSDEGVPEELALRPTAQGYALGGVALGRDGRPIKGAPADVVAVPAPPLSMPAAQRIEAAAFDPRRGEGMALVSEAGRARAIRFGALGEPVGKPLPVDERAGVGQPASGARLAAAGETWGLLAADAASILVLTGPLAGRAVPLLGGDVETPAGPVPLLDDDGKAIQGAPCWLLPLDQDSVEAVCFARVPAAVRADRRLGAGVRAPLIRRVFVQGGGAAPWVIAPGWLDDEAKQDWRVTGASRGARGQLQLVARRDEGEVVELWSLRGREWDAPVRLWEGMGEFVASVVPVWRDEAVLLEQKARSVLHWPGRERTVIERRTLGRSPHEGREAGRVPGPLLGSGDLVLAAGSPEPIAVERATPEPPGSCPASFATGPRRVVLLCFAAERGALGARLGTRVLRF